MIGGGVNGGRSNAVAALNEVERVRQVLCVRVRAVMGSRPKRHSIIHRIEQCS